jgi:hypothetical protein
MGIIILLHVCLFLPVSKLSAVMFQEQGEVSLVLRRRAGILDHDCGTAKKKKKKEPLHFKFLAVDASEPGHKMA